MADPPLPSSTDLARTRTDLADERTTLALTRTTIALDRTLMAWIRTSTSLISFGFTIYKFFVFLASDKNVPLPEAERLLGPRGLALVMLALGVGGLLIATVQYHRQTRTLREAYHQHGPFHLSLAAGVAVVVSGLGMCGFLLVLLRL